MSSILGWWHGRSVRREIAVQGWACVMVRGGEAAPPFGYSVGFDESFSAPEMIVFSLPERAARNAMIKAAEQLKAGDLTLADGERWTDAEGRRCVWRQVHATQLIDDYFDSALRRRRERVGRETGFTACQLVWPDDDDLFPWERGCAFQVRMEQVPLYEARDIANPDSWIDDIRRDAQAGGAPQLP